MSSAESAAPSKSSGGWRKLSLEKKIAILFAINAVINWTLSARGIIDPVAMAAGFQFEQPPGEYAFVTRLWASFVFMFGCMFWEVSRNVRSKAALIKYNWIEKTLTAAAVTLGFWLGETPPRLMMLIFLTNWLWIPPLIYLDVALRTKLRGEEVDEKTRVHEG